MPSNSPDLDYLAHLANESARFARVLGELSPDAKVPSCPDWAAADLLWHLGEVQWFWGTVVRERVDADQAGARKPSRPADWDGLREFYADASRELGRALAASTPQAPAWTWSRDQTVGFIRRRQAHEALIHRIDAELTGRCRTPMDGPLSADGVDEVLRVMYGDIDDWGTFTASDERTLRITTSDTGHSWLVTLGRFTGIDPDSRKSYDEPCVSVRDYDPGTEEAAATITATAADLDCWLWHRPPAGQVTKSGDADVLSGFSSAIAPGIN